MSFHARKLFVGGVNHQVGAFGHDIEIIIGDQCRDLNDDVFCRIESGHF